MKRPARKVLAFLLKGLILIDDKLLPATLIHYVAHEIPVYILAGLQSQDDQLDDMK
ncbi:hypothetical protein B597_002790 [Stutzerimonas stutzeri KOS6]|uniref:Uncharacterized protein n=1 Tax=Stutzerimonas stutzeri KOS6 TaxID=1218352 RepID=A0A061JWG7_STUST|nr:hypothetical protein B597_002790 [Stutzerimonas stutzeri KOS6]